MNLAAIAILTAFATFTTATVKAAEETAPKHESWSFQEIRLMPVQSGGRMKPLDSLAREATLFLTGTKVYQGWDPVDLLFSWLAFPQVWQEQKFIRIRAVEVRRQLQLDEARMDFSPRELFGNFPLLQYAQRMDADTQGAETMSGKSDRGPKVGPREQELRQVLERLGLFRQIVSGEAWAIIPRPAGAQWLNLAAVGKEGDLIRNQFVDVIKSYQAGDESAFNRASTLARAAVEGEVGGWGPALQRSLAFEVFYNHWHPFQFAWAFYFAAAIFFLLAPGKLQKLTPELRAQGAWRLRAARGFLTLAILSHVVGIAIRCYIAGRPPVTNMYESIVWVSLGVVFFATVLFFVQKQTITLLVAGLIAGMGLIAADSAPAMIDPGLHPLVPVLRDNFWLTVHVLTITLGYSAFALTLGLANVTLWNFLSQIRARKSANTGVAQMLQLRISGLNQLTYRSMQFGIVLIAAGTILGGVWADYSWGRFWGWDPKEVWALIALLSYLVILHGRMTSWIGPFAFAAWTVVGFLSVLMAWYGVNFILGVGLHSYGFASGGTTYVAGFTGLQLLYVVGISVVHWKANRGTVRAKSKTPDSSATVPR